MMPPSVAAQYHRRRQRFLPFHRLLNQPIEHRHPIGRVLLRVLPHAAHIRAGVDQLDHVQQIMTALAREAAAV